MLGHLLTLTAAYLALLTAKAGLHVAATLRHGVREDQVPQAAAGHPRQRVLTARRMATGTRGNPARGNPGSGTSGPAAAQVQRVPLRVKLDGAVSLLAQVPWKPNKTMPPGLMAAS